MTAAPDKVGGLSGDVLVISVNRRTFWTVLRLQPWRDRGPLRIGRKAVMDDCNEDEAWTARRVASAASALETGSPIRTDPLHRWTRSVEFLASGMSSGSLAAFGIDYDAVEHWSWPVGESGWQVLKQRSTVDWSAIHFALPQRLKERLREFAKGGDGCTPLAVVVESPVGVEATSGFERLIREVAPSLPVLRVTGHKTAEAAAELALALGRDPAEPAWLDAVPGIELEVRTRNGEGQGGTATNWLPVVPSDEVTPAGETYHTTSDEGRVVTLAPGIEHIRLRLRRGGPGGWDERYTGYPIEPSDHERRVEPLARVRPLSGEARIEIVEHHPGERVPILLAGSRSSVRWSEMESEPSPEMRSIPELYVFRASEQGWEELRPILEELVRKRAGTPALKDKLYKCTQRQWKNQVFPLGSDGHPPRASEASDPRAFAGATDLLAKATGILLNELEQSVESNATLKPRIANREHLPLTWLFTGCPEGATQILLDALLDETSAAASTLLVDNPFSLWSIYQGIGRTVRSDDHLKSVFDDLVGAWEASGASHQDIYLLSAVTHPLARRVSARRVLGENKERFDRVLCFLRKQLDNVLQRVHDNRPSGIEERPSLELRYITMGYRGICQTRYAHPDWFPVDGSEAREVHDGLKDAWRKGRKLEKDLVNRTAPYLIGEGVDPTMPGGF